MTQQMNAIEEDDEFWRQPEPVRVWLTTARDAARRLLAEVPAGAAVA